MGNEHPGGGLLVPLPPKHVPVLLGEMERKGGEERCAVSAIGKSVEVLHFLSQWEKLELRRKDEGFSIASPVCQVFALPSSFSSSLLCLSSLPLFALFCGFQGFRGFMVASPPSESGAVTDDVLASPREQLHLPIAVVGIHHVPRPQPEIEGAAVFLTTMNRKHSDCGQAFPYH